MAIPSDYLRAGNEPKPKRTMSEQTRQRMARAHLSRRQARFIEEYVSTGNASEAVRRAGYSTSSSDVVRQMATQNLAKPHIASAIKARTDAISFKVTPDRVQRRLDEISHEAQSAGQFGPAVRAEELLGRSVGMFIDRSLQLSGQLNDSHVEALLEIARKRQAEPVDLADDEPDT